MNSSMTPFWRSRVDRPVPRSLKRASAPVDPRSMGGAAVEERISSTGAVPEVFTNASGWVTRWAARLALPTSIFLAMRLVISRAVGSPILGFEANRWARWDSTYYQWIARYGYFHGRSCTGLTPHPVFKDARSCSDVAWYPGYSYLTRVVHSASTLSLPTTALLLAAAFSLANLIVIWVLFLRGAVHRPERLVSDLRGVLLRRRVHASVLSDLDVRLLRAPVRGTSWSIVDGHLLRSASVPPC